MNIQEMLEHLHKLLDNAQITKQEMVNEHHEPSDLPPVLWYVGQDGQDSTLLINRCPFHDHMPPEILGIILVDEYAEHGKPVLITVGSEGYVDVADEEGELSVEVRRGEMANDFMTNPASKIREAVFIAVCQDDMVGGTEMVQITAPFSYDDGLQLVWHERIVYADDDENFVGGELSDVMRNAFTATEEQWTEMVRERHKLKALDLLRGALEWPTTEERGGWTPCGDEEVAEELASIEKEGLDVTEQVRSMFTELDPPFAEAIERADLVWDGTHSFGIGIKMTDPGFERDPPDPPMFLHRLIKMLNDSGVIDELEGIPIKHEIFHAMKTFAFREEMEETLGKEEGHEPDSG